MELDTLVKRMIKNSELDLNTTMICTVTKLSPLTVKPDQKKKYASGSQEYPIITGAKKLKEWITVDGVVTAVSMPIAVNDKVLVAFGKNDLSDAVILGVIDG